jgi:4-amino-4-deoxy-L-arabinose transferase-like glycosyltransferase
VAFSSASGIFHPYYMSQLAPFAAVLVGATVGVMLERGLAARAIGAAAIVAGAFTEVLVLRDNPGQLTWLAPVLVAGSAGAAALLLAGGTVAPRARAVVVAAAMALLLLAPAAWSVQTLGHATNGTFPAGGPAASGFGGGFAGRGGPPGGGGGFAGGRGGFAGGGGPPGGGGGGRPFGGNDQSLSAAVAYVRDNGGGTIAVSSQSGAAGQLITAGAGVAAIGGFSGRESQVTTAWLADAVARGQIRWVLTDTANGIGMRNDGRIGSSEVMAAVQQVGTPVNAIAGLYDLQGQADALRSL